MLTNNSNRKVAVFVTLAYHPLIGGTERQAKMLAERWVAAGQPVWVLTRRVKGCPSYENIQGVDVFRLWSLWVPVLSWVSFSLNAYFFLFRRRRSIGCLIAQMLNVAAWPAAMIARACCIPLLIKPSAGGSDGNLRRLKRSPFGSFKLSFLLASSAYLIAINQEVVAELEAEGVPKGRIQRIPNGVDTDSFRPVASDVAQELRQNLGLAETDLAVLFVGRIEKVKNLDVLLSAWPEVLKQVPTARLLLAGDGPERARLEGEFGSHSLGAIRFLGARTDVSSLYPACDVFVLPSFREGISNALLEAMACGLTPVASCVGGNVDALHEWAPELLVQPGDSEGWVRVIISLLKDKNRREQAGQKARSFVDENYSAQTVWKKYDLLFKHVQQPYFQSAFPILAYHRVCPVPQYGIDVSVTEFERQIAWLAARGYQSLTLGKLYEFWRQGMAFPSKSIVITFDDGHREIYEYALPILRKYRFQATVFLNSGFLGQEYWIGGRRPGAVTWHDRKPADYQEGSPEWRHYVFMSWDEARDLQRQGLEIGSHGVHHPFLTALSNADLQAELVQSKQVLERELHQSVEFFCYPSGDFDPRVEMEVERAGYKAAVESPNHYCLRYGWEDPFAWERIGIWQDVRFWKFKGLVSGGYPAMYRRIPGGVWRAIRAFYRLFS